MHKMGKWLKKCVPVLSVLPFVLGAMGYTLAGERLLDALYYSFSLYFVNLVSDSSNVLVEIARWTAALVTTTAVMYALKRVWTRLSWTVLCLGRDSVAVYCDGEERVQFPDKGHCVIYPGREFRPSAKSHIIMLKNDRDSLAFYGANQDRLRGHPVYIGLRELDKGFMQVVPGVTFYDIDGAAARTLWKTLRLWRLGQEKLTVVIWGGGHLGQNVLDHGLLLNLFSPDQKIAYHLVGDTMLYQVSRKRFFPGNADTVSFHDPDSPSAWEAVRRADVVILAQEGPVERIQALRIACEDGLVYYYAPQEADVGRYLKFSGLHDFGKGLYTDENIRGEALIRQAKCQHYDYIRTHPPKDRALRETADEEWKLLDGFTQWSNISSADFQEVLPDILAARPSLTEEALAKLEHLRWCRFHTLNGWQYGVPEDPEASKDKKKKLHKCLCPYEKLEPADREKDRSVVRQALSNSSGITEAGNDATSSDGV